MEEALVVMERREDDGWQEAGASEGVKLKSRRKAADQQKHARPCWVAARRGNTLYINGALHTAVALEETCPLKIGANDGRPINRMLHLHSHSIRSCQDSRLRGDIQ